MTTIKNEPCRALHACGDAVRPDLAARAAIIDSGKENGRTRRTCGTLDGAHQDTAARVRVGDGDAIAPSHDAAIFGVYADVGHTVNGPTPPRELEATGVFQ